MVCHQYCTIFDEYCKPVFHILHDNYPFKKHQTIIHVDAVVDCWEKEILCIHKKVRSEQVNKKH